MINFSVCEQSGRTFELNLEDLEKLFSENEYNTDIEFENEEERIDEMIKAVIDEQGCDVLCNYEKSNSYYEYYVQDVEIKK